MGPKIMEMSEDVKLGLGRKAGPSAAEVKALRASAGLTQAQCAEILRTSIVSYQQWESESRTTGRQMHPAMWEVFQVKVMLIGCGEQLGRAMTSALKQVLGV